MKTMTFGPITSWQIDGKLMETLTDFIFFCSKITAYGDSSHEIKRLLLLGRKIMTNLDSILKKQGHYFADKGPYSQSYGFSSSHVWIWELDHKESWVLKNWCFWTVVLEKTLESPLNSKEIKSVSPKGNQSWIFIGLADAETEAPIFWPPAMKNWLTGKDPDAGQDWKQKEKGMTKDETVGWHYWLNGHEYEQAPGDGEGQGSLVCCSPWGCKQLDTTEQLRNNTMLSGLPRWLSDKEPTCQCRDAEDLGLIPGSERYPGLGNGNPLQYPYWKNPMDRGALCATVHRVTKSQTQLNDWACTHALCYPRMEWLHNPTKLKN